MGIFMTTIHLQEKKISERNLEGENLSNLFLVVFMPQILAKKEANAHFFMKKETQENDDQDCFSQKEYFIHFFNLLHLLFWNKPFFDSISDLITMFK